MTLLEGTENGLDFCPLSVYFLVLFFFISKVIYFLWDWLVAEKMEEKNGKKYSIFLALGFMLVLQNSDC